MDPAQTVRALTEIVGRGPGTDAERRAALWARDALRRQGRDASLETAWVRPHWPAVHALHAALGVGASILSVPVPAAGLALGLACLVSVVGDLLGGPFLLRRLTPARATQNVVSPPPAQGDATSAPAVRLVVCASLDAPPAAAIFGAPWADGWTRLRRLVGGHLASPLAVLPVAIAAITALAGARLAGADGNAIGAAQLVPTVLLIAAAGLLVDVALSEASPGAGANASAVAVALAVVAELDSTPLRHLEVEVVLAGAGEGPALGMRAYVRARRKEVRPHSVAVLALAPCAEGRPAWWTHDGLLTPLRLHGGLIAAAAGAARDEPRLAAGPHRGHGCSPAYPARLAGWPAITVGCLDERGRALRAGSAQDIADRVNPGAMEAACTFCLALAGRLDADLDRRTG
jgi:type IV secretory pathway VirB2 component (pilin)